MITAASAIRVRTLPSCNGEFYLAVDDEDRPVETGWLGLRDPLPRDWRPDGRAASALATRVRSALQGEDVDFSDVEIPAASDFFLRCRRAVQSVPAGSIITYGELARRAGRPAASRAAGQAMRRNPTPIIVPCHRVVAANGLGGFAGAVQEGDHGCPRIDLKSDLLRLERERLPRR